MKHGVDIQGKYQFLFECSANAQVPKIERNKLDIKCVVLGYGTS